MRHLLFNYLVELPKLIGLALKIDIAAPYFSLHCCWIRKENLARFILDSREELAQEFERIAEDLEKAANHCRITSKRYFQHDVPRACAHAFAAIGHVSKAQNELRHRAEVHSEYAQIHEDE